MRVLAALACSWLCALADVGWSFADETIASNQPRFVTSSAASAPERKFAELVGVRAEAIDTALGPLLEGACASVRIEFAKPSAPTYPTSGYAHYDPVRHVLTFRRNVTGYIDYDMTPWARSYWPYYQDSTLRSVMPIIGVIDEALWTTHLQEAAHQRGLLWPHHECASMDLSKRLGCQMLIEGTAASLRPPQPQIFNMNRIDLLWPDKLAPERGARDEETHRDVRRLGGLLLVRPLVARFGVTRVLRYLAQHPFHIESDNVHASALRYQERAERALESSAIN
jgi:hypothetical protein